MSLSYPDFIALGAVALAAVLAAAHIIKNKKSGANGCGGCPYRNGPCERGRGDPCNRP